MGTRTIRFALVAQFRDQHGPWRRSPSTRQAFQGGLDYKGQMVNNCAVAEGISITYTRAVGQNPRERDKDATRACRRCADAIERDLSCQTNGRSRR